MSVHDNIILNAILNPNTPFDMETSEDTKKTKYELTENIKHAKQFEIEGVRAAEASDIKLSIELFTKAISLAPNWASAYNNRAQAFRLSNRIDESLSDLKHAIELSKEFEDFKVYALALAQKGTILRLQGKDEEALECFKLAAMNGNAFAKQQVVSLNPYAAMCNKMLSDLFCKIKSGETLNE